MNVNAELQQLRQARRLESVYILASAHGNGHELRAQANAGTHDIAAAPPARARHTTGAMAPSTAMLEVGAARHGHTRASSSVKEEESVLSREAYSVVNSTTTRRKGALRNRYSSNAGGASDKSSRRGSNNDGTKKAIVDTHARIGSRASCKTVPSANGAEWLPRPAHSCVQTSAHGKKPDAPSPPQQGTRRMSMSASTTTTTTTKNVAHKAQRHHRCCRNSSDGKRDVVSSSHDDTNAAVTVLSPTVHTVRVVAAMPVSLREQLSRARADGAAAVSTAPTHTNVAQVTAQSPSQAFTAATPRNTAGAWCARSDSPVVLCIETVVADTLHAPPPHTPSTHKDIGHEEGSESGGGGANAATTTAATAMTNPIQVRECDVACATVSQPPPPPHTSVSVTTTPTMTRADQLSAAFVHAVTALDTCNASTLSAANITATMTTNSNNDNANNHELARTTIDDGDGNNNTTIVSQERLTCGHDMVGVAPCAHCQLCTHTTLPAAVCARHEEDPVVVATSLHCECAGAVAATGVALAADQVVESGAAITHTATAASASTFAVAAVVPPRVRVPMLPLSEMKRRQQQQRQRQQPPPSPPSQQASSAAPLVVSVPHLSSPARTPSIVYTTTTMTAAAADDENDDGDDDDDDDTKCVVCKQENNDEEDVSKATENTAMNDRACERGQRIPVTRNMCRAATTHMDTHTQHTPTLCVVTAGNEQVTKRRAQSSQLTSTVGAAATTAITRTADNPTLSVAATALSASATPTPRAVATMTTATITTAVTVTTATQPSMSAKCVPESMQSSRRNICVSRCSNMNGRGGGDDVAGDVTIVTISPLSTTRSTGIVSPTRMQPPPQSSMRWRRRVVAGATESMSAREQAALVGVSATRRVPLAILPDKATVQASITATNAHLLATGANATNTACVPWANDEHDDDVHKNTKRRSKDSVTSNYDVHATTRMADAVTQRRRPMTQVTLPASVQTSATTTTAVATTATTVPTPTSKAQTSACPLVVASPRNNSALTTLTTDGSVCTNNTARKERSCGGVCCTMM